MNFGYSEPVFMHLSNSLYPSDRLQMTLQFSTFDRFTTKCNILFELMRQLQTYYWLKNIPIVTILWESETIMLFIICCEVLSKMKKNLIQTRCVQ